MSVCARAWEEEVGEWHHASTTRVSNLIRARPWHNKHTSVYTQAIIVSDVYTQRPRRVSRRRTSRHDSFSATSPRAFSRRRHQNNFKDDGIQKLRYPENKKKGRTDRVEGQSHACACSLVSPSLGNESDFKARALFSGLFSVRLGFPISFYVWAA